LKGDQPQVDENDVNKLKETVYKPLENYEVGRNEIVAGTVSPSYLLPLHGLQRLEKLMDEYVGGNSTFYVTSEKLLNRGMELLAMLKEDLSHLGAEDLHQLQRAWELHHRVWTAESVTRHTLFRRTLPAALSRRLSEAQRQRLARVHRSHYDAKTGEWRMEKLPVHHIIK
jgi:adenylylsulfate reductase subunit A